MVNQALQNHGIEKFMRGLADKIKNDPNTNLSMRTETRTFSGTTRLKSIQYQLDAKIGGKVRTMMMVTIEVLGTKIAPTAKATIDYVSSEFTDFLVSASEEIFEERLSEDD